MPGLSKESTEPEVPSLCVEHLYVRTTKKFFYQCVVHRVCVTLGSQRWWSWAKKARARQIELRRHTVRPNSTNPPKISELIALTLTYTQPLIIRNGLIRPSSEFLEKIKKRPITHVKIKKCVKEFKKCSLLRLSFYVQRITLEKIST